MRRFCTLLLLGCALAAWGCRCCEPFGGSYPAAPCYPMSYTQPAPAPYYAQPCQTCVPAPAQTYVQSAAPTACAPAAARPALPR